MAARGIRAVHVAMVSFLAAWSLADGARMSLTSRSNSTSDSSRAALCTPLLTRYICQKLVWAHDSACVRKLCHWPGDPQQECCDVMGGTSHAEHGAAAPSHEDHSDDDAASEASEASEESDPITEEPVEEPALPMATLAEAGHAGGGLAAAWYRSQGNAREGLSAASVALAVCLASCGGGECRTPTSPEECDGTRQYILSGAGLRGEMHELNKNMKNVAPGCSVSSKHRLTWNPEPNYETTTLMRRAQRTKGRVIGCFK